MSESTYNLCCKYIGKRVRIDDRYGNVHYGRITSVDRKKVYIMPSRNLFSLGIGFWGFGGAGFGYGIALGTILGVALVSAFDF
mgnify:CR=1 FL=1